MGDTDIYKDVRAYEEAREIPPIKILRFESFLFFGNLEFFKRSLCKMSGINPVVYRQKKAKVVYEREFMFCVQAFTLVVM